jgi:hypothetical protein
MELSQFLDGKTVALVGSAAYLNDQRQGKLIDSYDVVVRVNHLHPIKPFMKKHIGRRTDIIYTEGGIPRITPDNLKELFMDPPLMIVGLPVQDRIENLREVCAGKIPFSFIHESIYNNNSPLKPLTGVAALHHLLSFPITELYMTGFSFYLDNERYNLEDSCDNHNHQYPDSGAGDGPNWHLPREQALWFKSFYPQNSRIVIDDYLKELLEGL